MSISQQQGYANFNLYDIFANFLPGAVFIIGVLFPYVGIDGLFTELKVGGLLLIIVLSFAAGLFVQAVGGDIQSSGQDFVDHIRKVDREDGETPDVDEGGGLESNINISTLDAHFVEAFRAELGLSSDFEDWHRLHKLILAKLEGTSRSRALRLQALYLAMRGMAVTAGILSVWYVLYMVLVVTDVFPTSLPVWSLPCIAFLLLGVTGIFYERSTEFSEDVAKYMVIEYYLEIMDQQDRTIDLDFLDQSDRMIDEDGTTDDETDERDNREQFANAAGQLIERTDEDTENRSDE